MRLRLDLAYDGTDFHGWAAQPGLRTVQGELEAALRLVLRHQGLTVTCAGRTDAGVHARGQVAHLDVEREALVHAAGRAARESDLVRTHARALRDRLDRVLPPDVRVQRVSEAAPGFDARFAALWRRYAYRVEDRPDRQDPLQRRQVVSWPKSLDASAMNAAAARLLGEHDFAAYCRPREGATTVRRLLELRWERPGGGPLTATVRADAFCHSMVRALVGALVAVGEGRRPAGWPAEVLAGGRRDPAVRVMPAHGLTLEEVGYPAEDDLARRAAETRQVRTRG